ncbi:uncharacterized protein MAM_01534 [Metarhizium album ARSEF 1941]|uniref:Cell wall protein PhiA n=1 Tax=Metarhizium album (strain ARSEF 1941) TaxID=1081103 RepID=A0A0B2X660_METAS|nr:uncharacterized protein MAM_01534 [Metarhizium album ARSEF 1941]KHO00756.1 hypothetical protein MAM_01534 [Metarhizium album ARSEF 1941]
MKFLAISLPALAGSALAVPYRPQAFDIMALRSASPIHFAPLSAAQGSLFLNLRHQGATCKGANNRATFYLDESKLFLYSDGDVVQQVYVDRSGMGQGKIGYITGDARAPRNAEFDGWSIDPAGNLVFHNNILQACPGSIDDSWSVWLTEVINPGGNTGCLGFSPRSLPIDKPVSCVYS